MNSVYLFTGISSPVYGNEDKLLVLICTVFGLSPQTQNVTPAWSSRRLAVDTRALARASASASRRNRVRERRKDARNEPSHVLLVDLIVGILVRRDELSQPSRALEQREVAESADTGEADPRFASDSAPEVQKHPHRLLGREVGVARPREEAGRVEAVLDLLTRVALGHARCLLVVRLCGVKVCHALD